MSPQMLGFLMGFEVLDISGDVGLKVTGADLKELFADAGKGLYSLITDPQKIEEKKAVRVTLESHSLEGLLVSWLNELIFQFDTYGYIGKGVEIREIEGNSMDATVTGEDFEPGRHESRLLVKAATYHGLKIEKANGLYRADVIFDI